MSKRLPVPPELEILIEKREQEKDRRRRSVAPNPAMQSPNPRPRKGTAGPTGVLPRTDAKSRVAVANRQLF